MSDSPFSSSPGRMTIDDLAQRSRQEAMKFQSSGTCNEVYSLELFRRAFLDHDQAAWQVVYAQYQPLATYWVLQHSKFESTNEETAFFVNAAFARFWRSVSKNNKGGQFESLARLLGYLKCCVHTAIEDECRQQRRWPRDPLALDDHWESLSDDTPSLEDRTISKVGRDAMEWAVLSRLKNEEEVVVATLSWIHNLPPREIQARRPDLFADVHRIYVIKRNILSRLLRDPTIQYLRRLMR